MLVQTPHAEVRASGSRVSFSSAAGSTRVDPEQGTIEVTRTSDGQSIRVPSGSYAVAAQEPGPFVPRPLPRKFIAPLTRCTIRAPVRFRSAAVAGWQDTRRCGADGLVNLWGLTTQKVRFPLPGPARPIRACVSPRTASCWPPPPREGQAGPHLETATGRGGVPGSSEMKVSALAFAPNRATLVTGGGSGKTGGKCALGNRDMEGTAAFAGAQARSGGRVQSDRAFLATGTADGQVRLWDAARGVVHRTLEAHPDRPRGDLQPRQQVLVSGVAIPRSGCGTWRRATRSGR
jgi:hypothetical protein